MAGGDTVFVLWGEGCDEALAVAWVSRLRAEGRRVYLVGVSGRRNRGSYGVAVMPDIGLDEALGLADQAVLVIVPCGEDALEALRRDPRYEQFLALAEKSGARLLAHPLAVEYLAALLPGALVGAMADGGRFEST